MWSKPSSWDGWHKIKKCDRTCGPTGSSFIAPQGIDPAESRRGQHHPRADLGSHGHATA